MLPITGVEGTKAKAITGVEGTKTKTISVDNHSSNDPSGKEKTLHVDADSLAKAKAKLSQGLEPGQEIGQTKTATYKGKSMELGEGGRSKMMQDRITNELVNKGFSFENAQGIAKKQSLNAGVSKYGKTQMDIWGKAHSPINA